MSDTDNATLINELGSVLNTLAAPGRHHIAAGLRLEDDTIISAINLISNYGPGSVCAEQIAIAIWARSYTSRIVTVLALRATFDSQGNLEIVPPCGRCRELVAEYAPDSHCLIPAKDRLPGYVSVSIDDLLPSPFRRRIPIAAPTATKASPHDPFASTTASTQVFQS